MVPMFAKVRAEDFTGDGDGVIEGTCGKNRFLIIKVTLARQERHHAASGDLWAFVRNGEF
jgi:hypothetical protein